MLLARSRVLIVLAVALALLGLFLAGCSLLQPEPDTDPLADYLAALRPGFEVTPAQLAAMPRYSITVRIDPTARVYSGTLEVTIPITGPVPLEGLYFRLYPNLWHFGGGLEVKGARLDGTPVNYGLEADRTALHLRAPKPLAPGSRAQVWMTFSGQAPEGKPGRYTLFGLNEEILSLTNFYPILAKQRGDAWALEIAHPQGDVGFHDAALYRVTVVTPADQVIAASGVAVTRTVGADGWAMARYALGPAREFTLLISPRFQIEEMDIAGTRVRSYFLPEDAQAGRSALYYAVAALQVYSDTFGTYPYREMAVVEGPLTFHGMEFPALNVIGSETYNKHRQDLETLVVHEVTHQWWYNQVGSDQTQNPWLDEGLAEFSMYFYYLGRYGKPAADQLRRLRWEIPVQGLAAQGRDLPIGRPVADYKSNEYETVIYGKGALFFATLRDELGPELFQKLLRTYLERYRWRIATPADFQALAEEVAGRELDGLFRKWVEGKE